MRLLVVGAGSMGRWFARTVATPADTLRFADADVEVARAAVDDVGGRVFDRSTDETFDVVCVAVPIPATADVIEEYAERVDQAICDVTGTMGTPIASMREHAPERERLSLHPLFAPERAPGTVAAVTDQPGEVSETVRERLESAGNEVVETASGEHDEAMKTVQARAHTAILAFALASDNVPDHFQTPVSEALFDLVDQVTEGEARVYADIQAAFEGADDVAAAARKLADADEEVFVDIYERLS